MFGRRASVSVGVLTKPDLGAVSSVSDAILALAPGALGLLGIPAIMRSYTDPVRTNARVRADLARLLRAVDARDTYAAAEGLRGFDKPALVLWAADDKLFPRAHGRRLAELLPQGRFATIASSRTFVPEEQPEHLATMCAEFLSEHA